MTTLQPYPVEARQEPVNDARRVSPQRRNLEPWALSTLNGEHDYATHFAAACAVAAHALARGWTRSELWDRFEHLARLQAQADKRSPNNRRVNRFITRAWDYAEKTRKASSDPFTVRRAITAAREHAARARFTGRQHALALVLQTVLDCAEKQRTITPTVSVRTLELATGLGKSTAARALQNLIALDYLQQVTKSDGEKASTYRLRHTETMVDLSGTHKVFPRGTKGVSQLRTPTELAATDAFKALGRSAARVFSVLDELDPLTPAELAARTGLAVRTTRAALRELEAVGLVERQRLGRSYSWTARLDLLTDAYLERIALDYGTDGTRERRENTITEQRRRWNEWQAGRRAAREQQKARKMDYLIRPRLVQVAA
jgi:DNA-binding MarR family transcriptional regulator